MTLQLLADVRRADIQEVNARKSSFTAENIVMITKFAEKHTRKQTEQWWNALGRVGKYLQHFHSTKEYFLPRNGGAPSMLNDAEMKRLMCLRK